MSHLSRRAFASALPGALLSAGSVAHPRPAAAAGGGMSRVMAPAAQFSIGRFRVTALSDGRADMPFAFFTGRAPAQIEAAAAAQAAARPGGIRLVFNAYLLDDGERLILVDAGTGGELGRSGQLPGALEAVGVTPDSIDAVIVTHMHVDHLGGLVAGGQRNFPRAEIHLDRRDLVHWTDPARRASAPEFLKSSFDAALEVRRLYPGLQAIDGERQIARGVSVIDLTGHTPGHIGVRVEDAGQSLLIVSDTLFHPSLHPASADIGFLFEQDPEAARRMRSRFFPRAAEEKALIAATHMPFPGLGRIVPDEGRLVWLPAEWAEQG